MNPYKPTGVSPKSFPPWNPVPLVAQARIHEAIQDAHLPPSVFHIQSPAHPLAQAFIFESWSYTEAAISNLSFQGSHGKIFSLSGPISLCRG